MCFSFTIGYTIFQVLRVLTPCNESPCRDWRLHSSIVKKSTLTVFEGRGFIRVIPVVKCWVLALLVSRLSIGVTLNWEAFLGSPLAMQSLLKVVVVFNKFSNPR